MSHKQNRMRLLLRMLIAATAVMSGQASAASTEESMLAAGERMIARCLDYAASQQLTPLSVSVVDASGTLIAFRRQDGASAVTAEAALLKARTALRLNAPTAVLAPAIAGDAAARDAFLLMGLTTLPGGAPFAHGDRITGAVGVSGALPEHDAECASRATEVDSES